MSGHFHNSKYLKGKCRASSLTLGKEVRKCRICFEKEYFTNFSGQSGLAKRGFHMDSFASLHTQLSECSSGSTAHDFGLSDHSNDTPFLARLLIWIFSRLLFGQLDNSQSGLISPCQCSGSMKYVHRSCLNEWRYSCENEKSFYRCEQCLSEYCLYEFVAAKAVPYRLFCKIFCILLTLLHLLLVHVAINALKITPFWTNSGCTLFTGASTLLAVALLQSTIYAPLLAISGNIWFAWYRWNRFNFLIDEIILVVLVGYALWKHWWWMLKVSTATASEIYKSYPINKPNIS